MGRVIPAGTGLNLYKDIDINVRGGGFMSQAEAARLVVATAIVDFTKNSKLEQAFLKYDRHLKMKDTFVLMAEQNRALLFYALKVFVDNQILLFSSQ